LININQLRETRASKIDALKALGDNYDPAKFDALETEVRGLDKQIKNAATIAEFERLSGAAPDARLESEVREFSVAKAIREGVTGKLSGREAEVSAELGKGREVRGVMIPTAAIFGEARAMTVGGSAGATVPTDLGALIDRLRPTLAIQRLGATVIPGLIGNLDLPRLDSGPTASWVAEDGPATATDSTFDKVSLSPKTVSGEMYLSRRLTLQSGVAIENILRSDLAFVLGQAMDLAAIQGGGTNQPTGIITQVTANATSSTTLGDISSDLMAALETANVTGTTGFLTHSAVTGVARKLKDTLGHYIALAETFHGEPVVVSNNVPAISATHPLIYGDWSHLVIGMWSGVDILANPFSDASKGGLRLHAFLDCDIALRHLEAFSWKAV
jgi:HK97 family phage major capsid protein